MYQLHLVLSHKTRLISHVRLGWITFKQHTIRPKSLFLYTVPSHLSTANEYPTNTITLQSLLNSMNRYRGPTIGGPSKASASTLCQKCLKRDMCTDPLTHFQTNLELRHYSYECKAVAQERPYVSRPSRTQQLLNPKLVPRLTSDVPQDLLRK